MAFDEITLPLKAGYGSGGGPGFLTEVITIQGGFERRNQCWSQARRRYDARTGVVTSRDASLLLAFFLARAGRARGFRLTDWMDYTSAVDGTGAVSWDDQTIGSGDGVQTQFQLIKTYGSGGVVFVRDIRKPVAGSVRVGIDAQEYVTGWSVEPTTGIVTFAQAPASGSVVKAGFRFDVPVRFDTDRLNLVANIKDLADAEIPLVEVRA
jgi:uncharacterized protein (TIGR02217 family)